MPAPVRPVGETDQTGLPKVFAVLIVLTIVARSSAFRCVGAILFQHVYAAMQNTADAASRAVGSLSILVVFFCHGYQS